MPGIWYMPQRSFLERSVPHVSEVPTLYHEELCTPLVRNTVTRTKCTPNSVNNFMGRTKLQNANAIANTLRSFQMGSPVSQMCSNPKVP